MRISSAQARQFILAHQMLGNSEPGSVKESILRYIRRVGCIQYDPLNVVGTNPCLVLQARFHGFRPSHLMELLYSERKLLDGWDKNMSIFSVEDWPYFRRQRQYYWDRYNPPGGQFQEILPVVRKELDERGPLTSGDLEFSSTIDWAWAPTRLSRAVLESMFWWGELLIHHRIGTRKVYDYTAKHLCSSLLDKPDPNQAEEEYFNWQLKRRLGAVGMLWNRGGDAWLGVRGFNSLERNAAVSRLQQRGEILPVAVADSKYTFYIRREEEELLKQIVGGSGIVPRARIIAPLDNLLWDRKMINELFQFNYVWEVYKPQELRHYGYYVLPILYGDKFIARFEPKFDRKQGLLTIVNWWWEQNTPEVPAEKLIQCIDEFRTYLGADEIKVSSHLKGLSKLLGFAQVNN